MKAIADRRLGSALLADGPRPAAPADVVRWFGAVQAQDFGPAKWSLGQRLPGTTDAEVQRAFDAGQFLRTHVLRPTWHFVTPDDIRWLLQLTGPRVHAANAYAYRRAGLDDHALAKAHDLLAEALDGGEHRTRKELAGVLGGAGLPTAGFALGYVLMHAELDGLICSGAMRGKHHTYTLLERRVPPAPARDPDEALAKLVTRYFTSHGPATAKDLRWWSSLTLRDIARGVELAGDRLRREARRRGAVLVGLAGDGGHAVTYCPPRPGLRRVRGRVRGEQVRARRLRRRPRAPARYCGAERDGAA